MRRFLSLLTLLCAGACADIGFDDLDAGEFSGSVIVLWLDGGLSEQGGDGRFVYIPTPGDELRFTRPDGTEFTPGVIRTDGASIPRAAQVFKGYNPWGYAPAYVLHDWLFVARRCLTDGQARSEEKIVETLDFIDSAKILGEAMKALKKQNKIRKEDFASAQVISAAVAGPISRRLWEQDGWCQTKDRLDPATQKRVDAYLARFAPQIRTLRVEPLAPLNGVRAVARVGF